MFEIKISKNIAINKEDVYFCSISVKTQYRMKKFKKKCLKVLSPFPLLNIIKTNKIEIQ